MLLRTIRACLLVASVGAVALACSAPADDGAVVSACETRLTWKARDTSDCLYCFAVAPSQDCACVPNPWVGKCGAEGLAMSREADCTIAVTNCTFACDSTDCDCLDACYRDHDACRAAGGRLDRCLAEVCAPVCKGP